MEDRKPGYYAIITADVRYDRGLCANAKLLYGEITALASDTGECWASNAYFTGLYGVDETTIRRWLRELSAQGYIKIGIQRDNSGMVVKRSIFIHMKNELTSTVAPPPGKNTRTPPGKNTRYNSTRLIIKKINNKKNAPSTRGVIFQEAWEAWVDYRTSRKFPMGDKILSKHLAKLEPMDDQEAAEVIHRSIDKKWQGLFPTGGNNRPKAVSSIYLKQDRWRENICRASKSHYRAASSGSSNDVCEFYLPHKGVFSDMPSMRADMARVADIGKFPSDDLDAPIWEPYRGWAWKRYVEWLCKTEPHYARFFKN